MFIIKKRQLYVLGEKVKKRLTAEIASALPVHYPDWCINRTTFEVYQFTEEMVNFSHQHRFFEFSNILDLIDLQIKFDVLSLIKRHSKLKKVITDMVQNETDKIKKMKMFLIRVQTNL